MIKEEAIEKEDENIKLFNRLYDAIEISSDESTNPCSVNMSSPQQTNISDIDSNKIKEVVIKGVVCQRCKICDKNFKAPEFVLKHIKNRHAADLKEKFNIKYFSTLARDNYLQDPNGISETHNS